jgi:predicted 3-demethylubiquinone-9 3-methyltransferase (glyoxalase superfamily)
MRPLTPHLWFDREARDVAFELNGQPFMAISAGPLFKFNESISFVVYCETQAEIDGYWEKLSAVPAAEQCGWLKDKYGLSWQIVPSAMNDMLEKGTPEQLARVTQAFLKMKKFDIAHLQDAFVPTHDGMFATRSDK